MIKHYKTYLTPRIRNIFNGALLLSLSLSAFDADAVIARKEPIKINLPDGTSLTIQLKGDERSHQTLTSDGFLLLTDKDNRYVYAGYNPDGSPYPSSIPAKDADFRSDSDKKFLSSISTDQRDNAINAMRINAKEKIPFSRRSNAATRGYGLFSTNFPVFGEQKAIVILVEYKDVKFDLKDKAHEYFENMLNQKGFSTNGATGSARDWFIENSEGKFLPQFDLFGPVELSQNRSYYGANDRYGDDLRPDEMVIEACRLLDGQVDFSEYDRDHDGFIDNVYVFYAGKGEADGGGDDTIWPHSWEIFGGTGKSVVLDGVVLDHYACSNETDNYTGIADGIGTFVHEFSHVMGLPDLYATVTSSAFTPGEFSVMDYGPYNNNGRTPPNYSAFELSALGWTEPEVPQQSGAMTIHPLSREKKTYMIPTSRPTEYYLFENRQNEGNDTYLPGHGMLLWHVDYVKSAWDNNSVNNNSSHQYVDLIEADNKKTEFSRNGDPFPGSFNVTAISKSTIPDLISWRGEDLGYSLSDIREDADGNILLNIKNENQNSSVSSPVDDTPFATLRDGEILSSSEASVFDISGVLIGVVSPANPLRLPARGVYIVRSGENSLKIRY